MEHGILTLTFKTSLCQNGNESIKLPLCERRKAIVDLSTEVLSIFLLLLDTIEHNSFTSKLNWSRLFFSLIFLDFLQIQVNCMNSNWKRWTQSLLFSFKVATMFPQSKSRIDTKQKWDFLKDYHETKMFYILKSGKTQFHDFPKILAFFSKACIAIQLNCHSSDNTKQ